MKRMLGLVLAASFSFQSSACYAVEGFLEKELSGLNERSVAAPIKQVEAVEQSAGSVAPSSDTTSGSSPGSTSPAAATPSSATGTTSATGGPVQLQGTVRKVEMFSPPQRIDELVKVALERNEQAQAVHAKSQRKFKSVRAVGRRVRDMAQFMTAYAGFESSSEAADVILNEKLKLKHAAAIEYAKQKQADEYHTHVTSAVMQIALGLGLKNPERQQKAVASGAAELEQLVGKEEADKTVAMLSDWASKAQVDSAKLQEEPLDILESQQKTKELLKTALASDSVVHAIEDRLHKFNRHSNLSRGTAKVVNTTLSIAMLSPTVISPAAQLAQLVFVALTGGPEESKLLKEVYLDRCFESRFKRLYTESTLITNSQNMAVMAKNPVLLMCSEALAKDMSLPRPVITAAANPNEKKKEARGIKRAFFFRKNTSAKNAKVDKKVATTRSATKAKLTGSKEAKNTGKKVAAAKAREKEAN